MENMLICDYFLYIYFFMGLYGVKGNFFFLFIFVVDNICI